MSQVSVPTVSVIVPAFNAARTIRRAIDSVFAQTTTEPVEVVVCDDGSTDETPALLAEYGDRLLAVRQENRGRGAARNACVARARGRFLAMLDADDWWMPERLERGLTAAAEHPDAGAFVSNAYVVDGQGTVHRTMNGEWHVGHSGWVFPYLLRSNFVPFPTLLVRRAQAEAAGPFDETLPRSQDLDWLLRLAAHTPFHYDREPLAWIDDQNWGTAEKRFATYDCYLKLLERLRRTQPDLVARYDRLYRKSLSDCHSEIAEYWEQQGEHAKAAQSYCAALQHAPSAAILLWRRSLALYRAGDVEACEGALREVLSRDEYHAEARFYLGNLRLRAGRIDEAIDAYLEALYSPYRYQKFPECLNNLAVAYAHHGEMARARELVEQALDQQRFYSDAVKNRLVLEAGGGAAQLRWTNRKVF